MEKLLELVDLKKCFYEKLNKAIVISGDKKHELENIIVIANNRERENVYYNGSVKKVLGNYLSTKYTFYFFSTVKLNSNIVLEFNNLKIKADVENNSFVFKQNKEPYFKYKYSGYITKEESF